MAKRNFGDKLVLVILMVLLTINISCSKSSIQKQQLDADIAFVGVDVITMENQQFLYDQTVLTKGIRIIAIGARTQINVPHDTRIIEAQGKVLMPGLVDAHIHLRHADSTALVEYLRVGITSAREMNGRPFIRDWRDRINAGDLIGPWLQVAAPTFGNFSSPREGYMTPETHEDAAIAVARFHTEGYDWIKIYTFLSPEAFEGLMEESNRLGIPVGGHVPVRVGMPEIFSSSFMSIEHLTEYVGSTLTSESQELDDKDLRSVFGAGDINWSKMDSLISLTKAAGIWNVPTLVWFDRILPTSRVQEAWSNPDLRAQGERNRREIVRRLHEAGALLAIGTDSDAGDDLGAESIYDEIGAMIEAGIDPEEVLRLATVGGATLLGVLSETGTVTVGKRADFILLQCDPRSDLDCLRFPEMVVARGQVVTE